jgi:hypothetical protein
MPSGGARVTSGPPPDPNALRRMRPGDSAGWTELPAEGRSGRAPRWPLDGHSPRERVLWRELWKRPQAVMWEKLDQRYEVALFARNLERAEQPMASVELQKVVRQYLDSLGLSVSGMLRNRWRLAETATVAAAAPKASAASVASARSRLTALRGGQDGG